MKVAVYHIANHHRSGVITGAMAAGIKAAGDEPELIDEAAYVEPVAPVAVFYGLEGNLPRIFADYKAAGRAVYVDLGYWGRRDGGRWEGFHKISVNDRHPTAYFMNRRHDASRAAVHGLQIRPWRRDGRHILLAGMGDKGALAEGYQPEQWEREAIAAIRRYSGRPIVYRPKPSWKRAKPIAGTYYSPRERELGADLVNCWAVVTHHSNVAVDGLLVGLPAFCWHGVATPLALQTFTRIESPHYPDGREEWAAAIAWTQFSVDEMRAGVAWSHLKNEGLVP